MRNGANVLRETSGMWDEKGISREEVKSRRIEGREEGGRCKLTKEQRIPVVGGYR